MGNRIKKLIAITVIFLLLLVIYIALRTHNIKRAGNHPEGKLLITGVSTEDITGLSFDYGNETYSYVLKDNVWYYIEGADREISQYRLRKSVGNLLELTSVDSIETKDLSSFGLNPPKRTISATTKDGSVITLYVGNKNETSGIYYMMKDSDDTVYIVEYYAPGEFDYTPEDIYTSNE